MGKIFKLSGTVTISVYTEVEADTLEQAVEIAKERDIEQSYWHQVDQSKGVWVNDEYDGEVQQIEEIK
jgi:hypothetical protein